MSQEYTTGDPRDWVSYSYNNTTDSLGSAPIQTTTTGGYLKIPEGLVDVDNPWKNAGVYEWKWYEPIYEPTKPFDTIPIMPDPPVFPPIVEEDEEELVAMLLLADRDLKRAMNTFRIISERLIKFRERQMAELETITKMG